MGVVTLLADVQGYIASLIAAAQNVNADGRILFFSNFGLPFTGKIKTKIYRVFS